MKILNKIRYFKILFDHFYNDLLYAKSFLANYKDEEVIFAKLRTQAHILDKGLHIIPFEKGHGVMIYHNCKELQNKITDSKILDDRAYKWVAGVIKDYENAQKTGIVSYNTDLPCQFTHDAKEQFYHVIKSRTSCRSFTNEVIDDGIWTEIVEIASDAPSGCCRQTARYYIESSQEKISLLIKNIAGATGFSGNIPYLICLTADIRAYDIKDKFLPYIDASLSVENFLLACTINNISSVCLNMQHASLAEQKNVKVILNIPKYEKIILFIAAGKPNVLPAKPARINVKWIRKR
jgi:nitroreductase